MKVVQVIALFCFVSQVCGRVIAGDANYYFKVLRLADAAVSHSVASPSPLLDRNCFFSPVQCMLSHNKEVENV